MLFVVHVDYNILSEAIHDRAIFYVDHADYDVLSKAIINQTLFHDFSEATLCRQNAAECGRRTELSCDTTCR